MFGLYKKMFIGLLTNIVNASNHTKCMSLNNQICMTRRTLINLHRNEYSQRSRYYPFVDNLDTCARNCNSLNELSNRVCVPNKTENLNSRVFNLITGRNELKTVKNTCIV